jgi:metallo-beta-lactamase family protein
MKITFLGAAGTVTGSKFLLATKQTRILVDCGLFQGLKTLRRRNWQALPVKPTDIDAVALTHAHLDHSGYLPVLVRDGFRGPIHCTEPTKDLANILLPDSGHLQEEDAHYANRRGFSKHSPARPLYTESDARRVAAAFRPVGFDQDVEIGDLTVRFVPAGHILGASSVVVRHGSRTVLISGDLGRPDDLLMKAPVPPGQPDWVVMESTYGDRRHEAVDPIDLLGQVVKRTVERRGVLLIPAFAVGRAQTLLYCLHQLIARGDVERVPIYLNSPMATDVTELYQRHAEYLRLSREACVAACRSPTFVNSVEESKALNGRRGPMIIVSASGMLTGGRVLHHLEAFATDPDNTILLAGFQAPGTRGEALASGARNLKVHGQYVTIKAEVVRLDAFSAHADQGDLVDWLGQCRQPPRGVILVHGEPTASDRLRLHIEDTLGYRTTVAEHGTTADL